MSKPDDRPPLLLVAPEGLSVPEQDLLRGRLERRCPLIELPPGAALYQLVDGRWEILAIDRRED